MNLMNTQMVGDRNEKNKNGEILMTVRIVTGVNGIKYITNEPFKPDYNTEAVLVEEMQRMAKRIEDLEALLERQTARIVDLQTHIENFDGEDR